MAKALFILLFFISTCAFSQSWKWETRIAGIDEFGDVSVINKKTIAGLADISYDTPVLYKFNKKGRIIDSLVFRYKDVATQLETDNAGNIYVVIKHSFPYVKVIGENEEAYTEYADSSGIYLEKYSSSLQLVKSCELLGNAERIDITDFVMCNSGFYISGRTTNTPFLFKTNEIHPGTGGSDFLMYVDKNMKEPDWCKTLDKGGNCCGWPSLSMHLAVDKKGDCIMTGAFSDQIKISENVSYTKPKIENLDFEMYLVGFSMDGVVIWSRIMECSSYDMDILSLSGGKMIVSGFSSDSCLPVNPARKVAGYGGFLAQIDPETGVQEKIYVNDTCSFISLCAGKDNDFYCLENSMDQKIYHFSAELKREYVSKIYVHLPVMIVSGKGLYVAGSFASVARFGSESEAHYLSGGFDGCIGKYRLK